jgi:tellurite resistance-related uncharacterized protein
MRSQEEINRQIEGLKAMKQSLPEYNLFGENNWEGINAQIAVLKGEENYEEYRDEEFDIEEDYIYTRAEEADTWLRGLNDDNLFE